MAFLKAKQKPLKPRAPKAHFELKTTLTDFKKKLKIAPSNSNVDMQSQLPGASQAEFVAYLRGSNMDCRGNPISPDQKKK